MRILTALAIGLGLLGCVPYESMPAEQCNASECSFSEECDAKHGDPGECKRWACINGQTCAVEHVSCGSPCTMFDGSVGACHNGYCGAAPECSTSIDCIAAHGPAGQCNEWSCYGSVCVRHAAYEHMGCTLPNGDVGACDFSNCEPVLNCVRDNVGILELSQH